MFRRDTPAAKGAWHHDPKRYGLAPHEDALARATAGRNASALAFAMQPTVRRAVKAVELLAIARDTCGDAGVTDAMIASPWSPGARPGQGRPFRR